MAMTPGGPVERPERIAWKKGKGEPSGLRNRSGPSAAGAASRSFLHRQVRSMTGSLVEVGAGRWNAADLTAALEARDRKACGPVAPACGLYLVSVEY